MTKKLSLYAAFRRFSAFQLSNSRNVKYVAIKPPYSQRYIRLKSLGENYSEEAIHRRILTEKHRIKEFTPAKDYNEWTKKYEPIKLKGFKALYYHYLYLFGKIRKRETPQRMSFYMREELIKLKRYQEQFHFLYENNIETTEQLQAFKTTAESKVEELIVERSGLYNKPESKPDIAEINSKLRELRKEIRLCNNIFEDAERIKERYEMAMQLEQEVKEQMKPRKKFRDKER